MKKLAWPVLRALLSTLMIGSIALITSALRDGGLHSDMVVKVAANYGTVGLMIFMAILIWDYWFDRAARRDTPNRPRG